ncbi:MOSC domain-containing protein [Candidatus Desulfarcum epimagneticum]|uniref:MOSC domain-containing protein n=1 Tax=uncultured Desulfobacteraceae bacterium TaxID=218296 RepID=A0A484HIS9_9BACT|nr:MOSC domain-containing protein [uncultured Desulfobacteraceae bacterium]
MAEKNMKILAIAMSEKKKTRKVCVKEATLVENHGIEGDAHAGNWHRQISFLASERIEDFRKKGGKADFGDFAENIATTGVDWKTLPVGTRVRLGESALAEITQIGKKCHQKCEIYHQTGDCIMPREGVFAKVLKGGKIRPGDTLEIKFS